MRTGDEPRHARSALRLRMFLAIFGLACAVAGVALFARTGITGWMIAFIVLALVAAFDLGRVLVHLRQGPHYQPGPATPPYPPVESASRPPHSSGPPSPQTRKRWYFLLMGLCLMLFVLAWAWVRLYSPTAAVVMTIVAMTIPPLAAIVANAGSPINRRRR